MCTSEMLNCILSEFSKQVKNTFGNEITDIILFGSYARGDYDSESDVDIAILADISREDEKAYSHRLVQIIGNIYEKFDYCVVLSPIVISSKFFDEWKNDLPFYRNVASEGVKIVA